MSITIYTEPNYAGISTTFDPNAVSIVYLNTFYTDEEMTKEEKRFEFVNNDNKINLVVKLKRISFTISSVKNNNGNFYLLGIGDLLHSSDVYNYKTNLIEGSVQDTLNKTRFKDLLVLKYPRCYYLQMIICLIIIVLLITYIVFLKFPRQK